MGRGASGNTTPVDPDTGNEERRNGAVSVPDEVFEWASRVMDRLQARGQMRPETIADLRATNERVRAKGSNARSRAYVGDTCELINGTMGAQEGRALIEEGRALVGLRAPRMDDPAERAKLLERGTIRSDAEFARVVAWVEENHDSEEHQETVRKLNDLLSAYYRGRVPEVDRR